MKKIVVFISLGFILEGCNKDDFSWDLPRNNQLDGQIDSGDGIQVPNKNAPKINTGSVSNITASASKVSGEITDIGSSEIYSYGHCWSLSPLPTIANDKTNLGSSNSSGIYTSSLSGLSANTTYYIRAYASNIYGTSYGNQVTFKTAPLLYEYINCESLSGFTVYINKIVSYSDSSWIIGSGYIGNCFKTSGSNYGGYIEFSRNFTKNVKLRFWTLSINPGYPSRTPDVLIDGIKVGTSKIASSPSSYSDWMQLETQGVILSGNHTISINFTPIYTYYEYYIDEIEFWSQ
jgi:hypothetical protein